MNRWLLSFWCHLWLFLFSDRNPNLIIFGIQPVVIVFFVMKKYSWVTELTDWWTDWMADWLAEWITDWQAGWLTDWMINWMTVWMTEWMTEGVTDWLTGWLTDWLTDWLTEWMNEVTLVFLRSLLTVLCSQTTGLKINSSTWWPVRLVSLIS